MNNSPKPTDLLDKLVSNHNAGKPLLEGATLYRGTRLPDQALGHFGKELHTSLLPQVAASYTHNWKAGGQAYIGTYPIDRDTTKFYADFGMEKSGAATPKAYSVADVEKALAPLVNNLATAKTPQDKAKAEQHIESLLKTSFYEAGVPAKTASGEATRPQTLYAYDGRPDTTMRRAVTMQMSEMSPAHEKTARLQMLNEHKSPDMQKMVEMLATRNQVTPAIAVLASVAARDHAKDLMSAHATKPLGQLIQDIDKHPPSDMQERLGKFAHALQAGVNSTNPATQQKAVMMASEVAKLNPDKATFADLVAVSGAVNAKHASSQAGATSSRQDMGGGTHAAGRTSGMSHSSDAGQSLGRAERGDVGRGYSQSSSGGISHTSDSGRDLGGVRAGHSSSIGRAENASSGRSSGGGAGAVGDFGVGHSSSSTRSFGGSVDASVGRSSASGAGSAGETRTLGEQLGRTSARQASGMSQSQERVQVSQESKFEAASAGQQSSSTASRQVQSRSMER